jgi:hypothetical protein
LLGESQVGGVGSVCALTPSHVLAEVYHHDALLQHRARGGVAAESCCWRVVVVKLYRHASRLSAAPSSQPSADREDSLSRRTVVITLSDLNSSIRWLSVLLRPWYEPALDPQPRASEISLGLGGPRDFAILPFLSSTSLSLLCPLPHSSERGSASTRAVRTHTHKCGRVFAPCEIQTTRHFNLLDDLPSCHSSSSTGSRCCDYCHVIP